MLIYLSIYIDSHKITKLKIIINGEMTCTKVEKIYQNTPKVHYVLLDTIMILIIFISLLTSTPRVLHLYIHQ